MKRLLLATVTAMFLMPAVAHAADTYQLDPTHTNILFHANHFGFSNPSGHFGITTGTLAVDEKDPSKDVLDVTIDVKSLLTGVPKLDEHLKSKDFLDADKFPTMTFKSTKVEASGQTAKVTGELTLHGVTKPVTLDVKLNKQGEHPMLKKAALGFSASGMLKRSDFGISAYVPNVSDEIKIDIETEMEKAEPNDQAPGAPQASQTPAAPGTNK